MIGSGQSKHGVVLDPPRPGGDGGLEAALAERGWTGFARAADSYHAMVETCLLERARVARAAWDGSGGEATVLVVSGVDESDGTGMETLKELLRAMKRYRPEAAVWIYVDGAMRLLHSGAPAPDTGEEEWPAPVEDRIDGGDRTGDENEDIDEDEDPFRISAAEIDMLLVNPGHDPGKDPAP